MIIYEVNLSVEASIVDSYLNWLKKHIKEILLLPGFQQAHLWQTDTANHDRIALCVQYQVLSQEALVHYFTQHAKAMRDDGIKRFGQRFTASRRVLTEIELNND